tara:strand:+ start:358 stop:777 length:420 start_codon:yes stop_codon:yes gene_type:complete
MLMLVLYSALMIHSIIPHVHHIYEDVASVEDHHEHHDSNGHEHSPNESPSHQQDSEGLLDLNLGHHTHSIFNSEYTTEIVRSIQKKVDSKTLVYGSLNHNQQELFLFSIKEEAPPLCRDFKPENPFLLTCSLRAPPSLG